MPEPIGEIPILITGDFSELEKDLAQAESIAERDGKQIADAFAAGAASGADIGDVFSESLKALGDSADEAGKKLGDAFSAAGAGAREYSTDAEALIEEQKRLDSELLNAQGTLAEIQNAFEDGAVSAATLARAQNEVTDAMERANPVLKESAEHEEEVEKGLKAMAEQLLAFGEALAVTEGLKEFGEEALKAYGAIQKTEIALKALTGDTTEGVHRTVEELKAMAVELGLDAHALEQAQVRLTAFGVEADKIPGLLRAAADAAAATDREFSAVASAVERMALAGTVSTRQLVALGLSVHDLAQSLHVADDELKDTFKDLDVTERVSAITNALQKYAGVAEEVGKGISAQWQNVKTRLEDVFEAIGEALAPVVGKLLDVISRDVLPAIQHLAEAFTELPEPIKEFAVAAGLAIAALAPLAVAVGGFGLALTAMEAALPAVEGLLASIGVSFEAVGAAASAAVPIIGAIAIAIAGIHFTDLDKEGVTFAENLKANLGGLADLFSPITEAVKELAADFLKLTGINETVQDIAAAFEKLGSSTKILKIAIDALFPLFALLREELKLVGAAISYLGGSYKEMGDAAKANLDKLRLANRDAFDPALFDGYTRGLRDATTQTDRYTLSKKEAAEAAKAHAAAEAAFLDEIGKVHNFIGPLTEDAVQLNQYFADAAKEIAHVSDAVDALADSNTLGQYLDAADKTIVDISGDSAQMSQYMQDAAASVDQVKASADALAADSSLQDWYQANNASVREGIELTSEWQIPIKAAGDTWEQTGSRIESVTQKLHNAVERDLVQGLSQAILKTHDFGKAFEKVGEDILSIVLDKILKKAIQPLLDGLDKVLAKIPGLSAIPGVGAGASVPGVPSTGGGGGAGGVEGLASPVTAISTAVSAITGVLQYLNSRRMEQDIGRIEVTERGILNQSISIQGTLNTYLPELVHLVDIWRQLQILGDTIALAGALGNGGGGGGNEGGGGTNVSLNDLIALVNTSVSSQIDAVLAASGVQQVAGGSFVFPGGGNEFAQDQPNAAANQDYAQSVRDATAANVDAAQQLHGAIPPAMDAISQATEGFLAPSNAQFATSAGAVTGSDLARQAAIQQSFQVPTSGSPGFSVSGPTQTTRLSGDVAAVVVNAVDPSGRQMTNAIVKGLEEQGIRTR